MLKINNSFEAIYVYIFEYLSKCATQLPEHLNILMMILLLILLLLLLYMILI